MLFKYYFCYGSLLLLAMATVFLFVCFWGGLSVGDPELPRWTKLCAFGMFYDLFLIMKIIINVFLYLYLLVIKPFNLLLYSMFMLWPALDCVLCSGCTAHKSIIV